MTSDGPLLFGVFYRPPNSGISTLEELNTAISSIPRNFPSVLCGNFNVSDGDWPLVNTRVSSPGNSTFCNIVSDNFLTQLVHLRTRGDNILDLIFTNCPNSISAVEIVDNLPEADYNTVKFVVSFLPVTQVQPNRVLFYYTKADFSVFLEVLSHIPWDCISFDSDVEYA